MLNIPPSPRVALLIDADNAQLNRLEHILKISSYYGTVTICRAYGDWKKPPLSAWKKKINHLSIELKLVERVGKDTTDKKLIIDASKILGAGEADTFIIVSGDADYRLLFQSIKEAGRKVIGIGNKKHTSKNLQEVCDTFFYIKNIEKELLNLEKTRLREFKKLLNKAFQEMPLNEAGWVNYGPLGTKLRVLEPEFDSKFGSKKLSEWLWNLREYFESRDQMVRKVDRETTSRIRLLREAVLQARQPDGWANRSKIGQILSNADANSKARFHGKKLSEWLEEYPHVFKTHEDNVSLL